MALIKRLLSLLCVCLLCGCGAASSVTQGSAAQPKESGSVPQEQPPLRQEEQPENAGTQDTAPLAGVTICLDAGHGITSARAQERISPLSERTKPAYVSGASGACQTEEELNLAVAQLAQQGLESLGARVIMTRETHEATVSNIERAQIANEAHADLCIRIHADGSDQSSPHGLSILIPAGDLLAAPAIAAPSRQAAACMLETLLDYTDAYDRGLVERTDLTGFNWSEVPCILLEMGFLSNPEEDARMATQEYREKIAGGIVSGVCEWIAERS